MDKNLGETAAQKLDCDFYAISCHKMYGPNGLGILYAKKKWVDELPPYQGGGGMINEVKKNEITYADSPNKFEAGTMQTAEVVAFAKSIKFIQDFGIKNIEKHESQILEYGLEKLRKDNSVSIIGNPKNRASIISFTIKGPKGENESEDFALHQLLSPFCQSLALTSLPHV